MIDFHSHILPGIDDGSSDPEETRRMLQMEQEQGVTKVLATPHFYASSDSVSSFLRRRDSAMNKVEEIRKNEPGLPEIQAGAEVYYFPHMGQADMLPKLCLTDTSILLLELPFVQWTKEIRKDVELIVKKQKLTVILAHVERYYEFQKDKSVWNDIMELPLYMQINTGSFQNRKKKRFDMKFIQSGYPVVLGSDCHNVEHRPPNLMQGRRILAEKLGDDILATIDALGRRILDEQK